MLSTSALRKATVAISGQRNTAIEISTTIKRSDQRLPNPRRRTLTNPASTASTVQKTIEYNGTD